MTTDPSCTVTPSTSGEVVLNGGASTDATPFWITTAAAGAMENGTWSR